MKEVVLLVEINTTAAREDVGLIEQRIRIVKEKQERPAVDFRSKTYQVWYWNILCTLQYLAERFYEHVWEAVFFSPREIFTGLTVDCTGEYKGAYIEACIDANITNKNMEHRQT